MVDETGISTQPQSRHHVHPVHGRGALSSLQSRPVEALRAGRKAEALDDVGVTFVKLGQVLSTRADLLATEFVEELGRPQPGASPVPWAQVPGLT
jgi:ubiquinone biosynthesis protein